ncbi:MAG: MerR family transcriptional regulator [Gammaproteobacteria bacterium]|jgi:DNA-binding transcriptional MerR regulator|nr:MerR family transcriptional regulator [Gammaproteobacteria bacterium]HJL96229.1 MerR family transcriptional regulator [SAR86 cluster bacterium]HJM58956.1 MerR family transcriptional regulator [SAR86 cluster bacterium]|tara:strand:+ start:2501 stop:2830 length:330 start_codon:yes stop_codon:yes gene_type:complete
MVRDLSITKKKYYSISEVSELCSVKPHTLRFWEKEFKDLSPVTRKGNRRYYQQKDLEVVKQIQKLLYDDGMTISGAKKSMLSDTITRASNADTSKEIVKDLEMLLTSLK